MHSLSTNFSGTSKQFERIPLQLFRISLVALLILAGRSAFGQVNPQCGAPVNGLLVCSMPTTAGTYQYQVDGTTATGVELTNNSSVYLQVDSVTATGNYPTAAGDLCVYRNADIAGQSAPGIGEVGCTAQRPGQTSLPPVTWYDPTNPASQTALAIAPGDVVYFGDSLAIGGGAPFHQNAFTVSIAPQTSGVAVWRQPQQDQIQTCNGTNQQTTWGPFQNNTGRTIYYTGATVYSATPSNAPMKAACLYSLDSSGSVINSQCSGFSSAGTHAFTPPIAVAPGQFIAGQALNSCTGGLWDWASYIWTFF